MTFTALGTGGSYKHKLSVSELPAHAHNVTIMQASKEASGYGLTKTGAFQNRPIITGDMSNAQRYYVSTSQGSNNSHNNTQPWMGCYYWRRTA